MVIIGANSRKDLEQRMVVVMNPIQATQKLAISALKSAYIFLKGNLRLDFVVHLNDHPSAKVTMMKYLGVLIDSKQRSDL